MLQVIFALLFAYVIYYTFKDPAWGVVGLFSFILCEKTAPEYIPFGPRLLIVFTVITTFSFFLKLGSQKLKPFDPILTALIVYLGYLAAFSFDTFFFDTTRIWASTYGQSFLLVFLISNTIKSTAQLQKIMLWMIIFGFAGTLAYVFSLGESVFEQEIEASNTYARLYLTLIIFAYSFYRGGVNFKYSKVIFTFLMAYFTFFLLISGSRTGLLMLIGLVIYYSLFDYKVKSNVFISLAILVIPLFFFIPHEYLEKMLASFDDSTFKGAGDTKYNSVGNNVRLLYIKASFEMLNDHNWFLGIGLGNFKHLFSTYLPFLHTKVAHPHNTYISVLVESGLIGLSIFMSFIINALKSFRIYVTLKEPQDYRILQAWFLAFILFLIGGLTKHDHYDKLLFLFLGVASAMFSLKKDNLAKEESF